MKVVTATNEDYSIEGHLFPSVFLAGGITNCPDWQSEAIERFKSIEAYSFTLYNPRRENFPIDDPTASEQQIVWEFNHLRDADIIIYWFASGSLNPIVLYELGMWGNSSDRTIFIGCDPDYARTQDVLIQTKLARPEQFVYSDLGSMCDDVMKLLIGEDDGSRA